MTGVPVVPLAYATRRRTLLNSWDRFLVPGLFTRGAYVWGEPVAVPRDADAAEIERLRILLEDRMNAITAEADRLVGRPTTEPAAPC